MESTEKQPWEEFTLEADFSLNMQSDETLSNPTVTAVDKNGTDVSTTFLDTNTVQASGQSVFCLIRGGTEDVQPYIVTFRAETSVNHKWELDVKIKVKD